MRKAYQHRNQAGFLPAIAPSSSRKELAKVSPYDSKENHQGDKHLIQKLKKQGDFHCLPRRSSLKKEIMCVEQLLDRKLSDREKNDIPTQPKMSKPWVAKEIDMNKLTTKTTRIRSNINNERNSQLIRRRSCQNNSPSSIEKTEKIQAPLSNQTTKLLNTTNNNKTVTLPRDKIYSCKIAMKRGVFPMNDKKQEQQPKVGAFFEGQSDVISTIYDKSQVDKEELFISFESYVQMDF